MIKIRSSDEDEALQGPANKRLVPPSLIVAVKHRKQTKMEFHLNLLSGERALVSIVDDTRGHPSKADKKIPFQEPPVGGGAAERFFHAADPIYRIMATHYAHQFIDII
jgi:hypothetical protein